MIRYNFIKESKESLQSVLKNTKDPTYWNSSMASAILGTGLGYAAGGFGGMLFNKLKGRKLDDNLKRYQLGGAALGALVGAGRGLHNAKKVSTVNNFNQLKNTVRSHYKLYNNDNNTKILGIWDKNRNEVVLVNVVKVGKNERVVPFSRRLKIGNNPKDKNWIYKVFGSKEMVLFR